MVARAEKIAWALERYGPEGFYADGERSRAAAERWAVATYDEAAAAGLLPRSPLDDAWDLALRGRAL